MKLSLSLSLLALGSLSHQYVVERNANPSPEPVPAAKPKAIPSWERRQAKHLRPVLEDVKIRRDVSQPIRGSKGAEEIQGQNVAIEGQNPSALVPPETDEGMIPNLKWSFALSNNALFNGGFIREQLSSDLPPSSEFAGAQNHLTKGSIRSMHWHSCDEWGYVTNGTVLIAGVDHTGKNTVFKAETGDIWYFPKGEPHTIQGLDDDNEYLLLFNRGDFMSNGVTFNIDDWIRHTPADILRKNFRLNETNSGMFNHTPAPFGSINTGEVSGSPRPLAPAGELVGDASWHYPTSQKAPTGEVAGGGRWWDVDCNVFPMGQNLVARIVELEPGAMRELHWHPTGQEWLYFVRGQGRATVWSGPETARTFDFCDGDTAVFPDNTGHYIENVSQNETLFYIEVFSSSELQEVTLQQWMALTPSDLVARNINVTASFLESLPKEKQVIIPPM
ncbi:Bicupin, oxalate decarboxylase/oxidase [Xylariomycetidae sp. FL0641]|nr:Bicupin, oxalate decarboxylase/oxidase [Xylariomycetidae sp. FL0641]